MVPSAVTESVVSAIADFDALRVALNELKKSHSAQVIGGDEKRSVYDRALVALDRLSEQLEPR